MTRATRIQAAFALAALLAAPHAFAWTSTLQECLLRDARRLVPRTLARLIGEREDEVLEEMRRFPLPLGQALAADLSNGTLRPETLAALDAEASQSVDLLRQQRVSEGVVRLAATLRIPADLADPVLTVGPEGYPSGVAREYYAFIEGSLDKLPVTLDDAQALKLSRRELPAYWQRVLLASRDQSALLRSEMIQSGRVVDHRLLDFRSPVFAVAQISYSRAVTAVAATWLALWREAHGDVTRQPDPVVVAPRDAPPVAPEPPPQPPLEASP